MAMRLLIAIAWSVLAGIGASSLARYDPLTAGEAGDDGTKDGLFGNYFSVPLLSAADGKTVVANVMMQLAISDDEDHHGLMFRNSASVL